MAITYNNPDEVAKVKHILSLAEHIAEKIDGSSGGSTSSTTSKATPTLTSSLTQWSASTFVNAAGRQVGNSSILTYNGDGDIFIQKSAIQAGLIVWVENDNNAISIIPAYLASNPPTFPVTFKVGFTATENYKACSAELTVTA